VPHVAIGRVIVSDDCDCTCSFQDRPVPCADERNLYSLTFDDFSLDSDEMLLAAVSMFLDLGLVKKFNIEKEVSSINLSFI
jgi:dual 3',5'-cyclic-AMP and -GMP phosphodiesterase 11